jgi:hypothetical protein
VLELSLADPPYTAVMVWVPTARAVVEKVAIPAGVRVDVPRSAVPSRKETDPVGMVVDWGRATAAVKVTDWPKVLGLGDEERDAVVGAPLTTSRIPFEVLPAALFDQPVQHTCHTARAQAGIGFESETLARVPQPQRATPPNPPSHPSLPPQLKPVAQTPLCPPEPPSFMPLPNPALPPHLKPHLKPPTKPHLKPHIKPLHSTLLVQLSENHLQLAGKSGDVMTKTPYGCFRPGTTPNTIRLRLLVFVLSQ